MNVVLGLVVVAVVAGVSVAAMLAVRRNAPDGGYFNDGDRAAGVFGVLATGFSVMLGFVIFLAFMSYDQSRTGAEAEARTVAQQIETAQLFRPAIADRLTSELVCYARSVARTEWDEMEAGSLGERVNPWGGAMTETIDSVEPENAREEAAFGKWLDQTSDREIARDDRIHGAVGVIPAPLWIVLFFVAAVIFVFMLFFADRGERAVVQAVLMGSVMSVVVAMLLLVQFLDNPFHDGLGGLQPAAMERALILIDEELQIEDQTESVPCDEEGVAREP